MAVTGDLKAAVTAADTNKLSLADQKKRLEAKKAQLRKGQEVKVVSEESRKLKIEYCWARVHDSVKKQEEQKKAIEEKEAAISRVSSRQCV